MANKIILKRSSVPNKAPVAGDVEYGELALNYNDGKLFYKKVDNTIESFEAGLQTINLTGAVTGSGTGDITTSLSATGATAGSYTNANITVGADGRITSVANGSPSGLPDQTGNSGKFLTTDGSLLSWGTIDLSNYQPVDADLTAIGGLTGTSGILTKTAADTWTLDTNTYLTTTLAASNYQAKDDDLTAISALSGTTGILKKTALNTWALDTTSYQPQDNDLTAIAGLAGTSGLLKKTAADTWTLDTSTYLTGITSGQVTTALGYTPYNSTNPNGYTTNTGTVTSVGGTGTVSGLTLTGSVTTTGNLTLGGTLTLTSANVTTALGYTPYNSSNPSGYITSSGNISGYSRYLVYNDGPRNLSDRNPNWSSRTVAFDFVTAAVANGAGNYGGVMTFSPWEGTTTSTGDASYQLAFGNDSGVNASGMPRLSIRNGIDTTWKSWYILLHSGNFSSYAATPTGYTKYLSGAQAYTNGSDGWWRSEGQAGWYNATYSVGIYATEAGNVRTYNGASFIAAGNITAYSDERFKTNWRDLPLDFIERLAKIKHGTYDRTDNSAAKTQDGVSAQSLKPLLPNSVLEDSEGILSVNYGGAAMVSAVQLAKRAVEQEAKIQAQDKRIAELERLISKIIGD